MMRDMKETFKSSFLGDGSCCFSHLLGMSINSPPLPSPPPPPLKFLLMNSRVGTGFPLFDLGKNSGWIASSLTMDIATLE